MKNKTILLATVGLFEMYYLNYPLELGLLYFNGIIILGTIYKLLSSRKKQVESVKLPVQTPEAKDEFQVKFERKLLDLYNKEQAEKQNKVLEGDSSPDIVMVGTMKDIPSDNSIAHELTELTTLHNQIRLMNQKLKTAK
ncbi:MAG: hypothetical protein ACW98F_17160 [Candidatus Hodarchaeales archaeon]|jgi:hypothetical protein